MVIFRQSSARLHELSILSFAYSDLGLGAACDLPALEFVDLEILYRKIGFGGCMGNLLRIKLWRFRVSWRAVRDSAFLYIARLLDRLQRQAHLPPSEPELIVLNCRKSCDYTNNHEENAFDRG